MAPSAIFIAPRLNRAPFAKTDLFLMVIAVPSKTNPLASRKYRSTMPILLSIYVVTSPVMMSLRHVVCPGFG